MVLLHGLYCCKEFWDGYLPLLPPDYRAVVPDLLGHGDSPRGSAHNVSEHVASVQALIASLEIQRTVLVGHSMGGILALAYALEYPEEVDRLVLVMTPFTERGIAFVLRWLVTPGLNVVAHAMNWGYFKSQTKSGNGEGIWPRLLMPSRKTIVQCAQGLKAFEQDGGLRRGSELSTPILCLHSDGEPTLGRYQVEAARRVLPQAQHFVIPNASHPWPVGCEEQFVEIVNPFLSSRSISDSSCHSRNEREPNDKCEA